MLYTIFNSILCGCFKLFFCLFPNLFVSILVNSCRRILVIKPESTINIKNFCYIKALFRYLYFFRIKRKIFLNNIKRIFNRLCSILNKLNNSSAVLPEYSRRNRKNILALICSLMRRDKCTATSGGFYYKSTHGKTGHKSVSYVKVLCKCFCTGEKLRYDGTIFENSVFKIRFTIWIINIKSTSKKTIGS